MKKSFLILALASLIAVPAHAEDMTKENIEAFLQETTELTHQNNGKTDDEIFSFLSDRIYDDGKFKSIVIYEIPGHPAAPKELTLDKGEFIANVIEGRKAMQDYESSVKMTTHKISGDSAEIETVTTEKGSMPVEEGIYTPFEGITVCKQTLAINSKQLIELRSANCETRLSFI